MINRLPLEYRLPQVGPPKAATPEASRASAVASRLLEKAARCIGSYPAASLATTFFIGLALGCWIKRR